MNASHYSRQTTPDRRYLVEEGMFTSQLHTIYVEWLKVKYPGSTAVSPWKFRDVYTKCYNILPRYVKSILVLVLNNIIMTKLIIMINIVELIIL